MELPVLIFLFMSGNVKRGIKNFSGTIKDSYYLVHRLGMSCCIMELLISLVRFLLLFIYIFFLSMDSIWQPVRGISAGDRYSLCGCGISCCNARFAYLHTFIISFISFFCLSILPWLATSSMASKIFQQSRIHWMSCCIQVLSASVFYFWSIFFLSKNEYDILSQRSFNI